MVRLSGTGSRLRARLCRGAAPRSALRGERGVTLVELLITLIIASLVAGSTFVFFAGQQRIYDTQTKVLNIQQNLWATMETITRFVRAAGTGMVDCVPPGGPPPGGPTAPLTGLRVFRAGFGVSRIPPIWIQNGAAGAPDRITVAFGNGTFGNYSDANLNVALAADTPTTNFTLAAGLTSMFRVNEFVLLLDAAATPNSGTTGDRTCMLAQLTGIDAATNVLQHASSSAWNPATNLVGLQPWQLKKTGDAAPGQGAIRHFGQLAWVQFSIDTTGPAPRLMIDRLEGGAGPQTLAEGVENLQIAYACDGQPAPNVRDGALTEGAPGARTTDEWIYNAAGDVEPVGCPRPAAIRITVVTRSIAADDTLNDVPGNAMPAVEDSPAGAKDNFRHRVMTTTLYPRN